MQNKHYRIVGYYESRRAGKLPHNITHNNSIVCSESKIRKIENEFKDKTVLSNTKQKPKTFIKNSKH
jgi:hypothetical protein